MLIQSNCAHCGNPVERRKQTKEVKLHFCNLKCKADWQRDQKGYTRDWLFEEYVTKGRSANDIAREVGRDPKRVWEWIRDYGIETRTRAEVAPHNTPWSKGHVPYMKGRNHSPEMRLKLSKLAKDTGRVPYDPLVGSYMKGRKGSNTPNWKGGCTPERQSFYSSLEWKDAVIAVWKRDNAICQRCGLDHRTVDRDTVLFHIHHIVTFAFKDLRAEVSNLVLLCDKCHRFVHSRGNVNKDYISECPQPRCD